MANDFKSFTKSNIAKDDTAYSVLYTALLNKETILLEIDIANTSGSDITVDCKLDKNSGGTGGTDDIFIVKGAPLPAGGALKVVSGQKIVMESLVAGANDKLYAYSSGASSVDVIASVLQDVS